MNMIDSLQKGDMKMKLLITVLSVALYICSPAVFAHGKSTERFIPVGQSPQSGKMTVLGVIQTIDPKAKTVTLVQDGRIHSIAITANTKIWLDRSKLKVTNLEVGFEGLKKGLLAEAKCPAGNCSGPITAEWIKVQIK